MGTTVLTQCSYFTDQATRQDPTSLKLKPLKNGLSSSHINIFLTCYCAWKNGMPGLAAKAASDPTTLPRPSLSRSEAYGWIWFQLPEACGLQVIPIEWFCVAISKLLPFPASVSSSVKQEDWVRTVVPSTCLGKLHGQRFPVGYIQSMGPQNFGHN